MREKLYKIKSLRSINGAIERNKKTGAQIELWPNL